MRKFSFLIMLSFTTCMVNSQVITKITQSPNNPLLLGVINSMWADAASTGWSTPDLTIAANAIEAELIFVDDAVSGAIDANGNPTWQDACEPIVNNLTGKIAVAYRSFCWHDIKANYAQQAGAIGLILINRDPGPFAMGGSTVGSSVTIPVVSIGSEEGDALKDFIAMGGVYAFIGTKVGLNANDLGSSPADIVMAHHQAIPSFLATTGSEFPLDLGLYVFNPGSNAQSGVTVSVDVTHNGSSVFTNTSTPLNFTAPVSAIVDTIYADLGTYSPVVWSAGKYNIRYSINLSNDEDTSDNVFNTSFTLGTNTFAKSKIDSLNNPVSSTAYSLNETTTQYDDWEACLVFSNANASRGVANGMTFSCMPVNGIMTNEIIEIRAYEWNDVFTDLSLSNPTFNNLVQVSQATHFYIDESQNGVNLYLPLETPVPMIDNKKYLFCVYNSSNELRLGYDVTMDYTATVDNYLQPISPVKILPNSQAAQWYWAGFGLDATPSISVTMDYITGESSLIHSNQLLAYPNPAANLLTVPVRRNIVGDVNIDVFDLAGKLVLSESKTIGEESLKINVASIPNGTYLFTLTFSDGSKDSFKVSVNR
jgi:hypothetical protein